MGWFRRHDCARDGHRFEPRYDEHPRDFPKWDRIRLPLDWTAEEQRDFMLLRTYVRDVCRHCGRTIERTPIRPAGDGGATGRDG